MSKSFDKSGFVIFSNDLKYEFEILDRYFMSDQNVESIIFVFSQKSDISGVYTDKLMRYNKTLLVVPFEEYNKIEYASSIEALDLAKTVMVIKDLRFMLKRLDERLSMMQIKHTCYKKIIIDTVPFVVDMWKIYYPYSFFDKMLLGYSHSYAFESAVRNFSEGVSTVNPYDPVDIARRIYPVTFISYKKYFTFDLSFVEHTVSDYEFLEYERLKNTLFSTETTIRSVISNLHKYTSSILPSYSVPLNMNKVYKWGDSKVVIHRTNLKVDSYLCSEMMKIISNTNTVTENLYGH